MGKFKDLLKKNDNSKLITVILIGMLILIIVMPLDSCDNSAGGYGNNASKGNETLSNQSDASGDIIGLDAWSAYSNGADDTYVNDGNNIDSISVYYENRLKAILEKSYGQGTMEVMVNVKKDSEKGLYGDSSEEFYVDGVLVVAKVDDIAKVADISNAVCALFNLPACKVAVLMFSN